LRFALPGPRRQSDAAAIFPELVLLIDFE